MKDKLVKLGLTDELAQKVVDHFGDVIDGEYVPKTRFNEVNNELNTAKETIKERDKQIESLGKDSDDIEALKKEKEDLIKANKEAAKEAEKKLAAERKSNAIKLELIDKVHNADVTMNLLNIDNIVMDDNGKVKSGLKEQLDDLKKSDGYLFKAEDNNKGGNQNNNAEPFVKGATPKDGEGSPQTNLSKAEQFAKGLATAHNSAVKNSAESIYFGE